MPTSCERIFPLTTSIMQMQHNVETASLPFSSFCVIVASIQEHGGDEGCVRETSANPRHSPGCYGWGSFQEHEIQPGLLGMRRAPLLLSLLISSPGVWKACSTCVASAICCVMLVLMCFILDQFFVKTDVSVPSRETTSTSMITCCRPHMKLAWSKLFPACPPASFLIRPPTLSMRPW